MASQPHEFKVKLDFFIDELEAVFYVRRGRLPFVYLSTKSKALEIAYLLRVIIFVVNASGMITIVSGIASLTLSSSSLL